MNGGHTRVAGKASGAPDRHAAAGTCNVPQSPLACLPSAKAWYLRVWRDFRMETPQVHDRMEIMYVLSGTCRMGAGDRKVHADADAPVSLETRTMRRGDFLWVDAQVPHTLVTDADGDCRMLNVEFRLEQVPDGMPYPDLAVQAAAVPELAAMLAAASPRLFLKDTQDVGALLQSLVIELDHGTPGNDWLVQHLFSALLIRIARQRAEAGRFSADAGERYVAGAIRFIREAYDRDLHVADIAAAVSVHPSYLQRLFRKSQGVPIVTYLTRVRVEQAKMLLLSTDLPVADLCMYVGLNSRQHFSAVFRQVTGMSPGEYRRLDSHSRFAP